jgi:ubiquinone/menaquinone biosynthesis C-methylase UbiE
MTSEYDHITAFHYASYRPSLHARILTKCFGNKFYVSGLDIGCGTGQSSIALAGFCDSVVGIDPSEDMLSKVISHSKISYSYFDKTQIAFNDASFDIITLAGSLWYAKSQQLLNEIIRVGEKNAQVFIYDFQVLLDEVLAKLGFITQEDSLDDYYHQENFSGLNTSEIKKLTEGCERMKILMTAKELAHLVLSVKEQYLFFKDLFGEQDLFNIIVEKISSGMKSNGIDIQADTFFTHYQLR